MISCGKGQLAVTKSEDSVFCLRFDPVSDRESEARIGRAEVVRTLIRSWAKMQDGVEQRGTFDTLVKGLDSERLSGRKLFPEELRGRSW